MTPKQQAAIEFIKARAADSQSLVWAEHVRVLEGMARDAGRYRWLRDQTTEDGIAVIMKEKYIRNSISLAANIDNFIDAALPAEQEKEK